VIWKLLLAGALGGVVGATELAARYRDDPAAALRTTPGLLYVAVNFAAAAAALVVVEAFGWKFGLGPDASALQVDTVQILVAGVGSTALFRSSLFTVRQGDQEISIGPSALLTSLLGLVDRGVDRRRALERLNRDDLAGLSFDRDHVALTELCTAALQNLDRADAQALGELAARLKAQDGLSDPAKLDCFALKLLTLVGPKAVQAAAQRIREREATEPLESSVSGRSADAAHADHTQAWRKRLAVIDPLVERPVPASGELEAGLELAWLYERLEDYPNAHKLYEELTAAFQRTSSLLTNHELEIAWSRTALAIALRRGYHLWTKSLSGELEEAQLGQVHSLRKRARERLAALCSRSGGRPSCYAAALYILVREGARYTHDPDYPHTLYYPELGSDAALGYLTDALELLEPLTIDLPSDNRTLICRLHFARAACHLSQGNADSAADDLVAASQGTDRDMQIISGSLAVLLQRHLPYDQALALSCVIEPYRVPFGPWIGSRSASSADMLAPVVEVSEDEQREWYGHLAANIVRYLPDLVPDAPLRTFDLISSSGTEIPRSFRTASPAEDMPLPEEDVLPEGDVLPQGDRNSTANLDTA
jgi:hypothetical protein